SAITISSIGLICKSFLNLGFVPSIRIEGLHHLLDALNDTKRRNAGAGVITVSNHISVLDEPLTWGILPSSHYFSRDTKSMRWALGASDIMFTNPVLSEFFRAGQVIETFRGRGIYQPAVNDAISLLNSGEWIHLFPESKVFQGSSKSTSGLGPFKWGM
ncbi:hypothetical protein SISSUDRAFT_967590, partial [Sistotremastrum suecicum HHB10207 ss-3]